MNCVGKGNYAYFVAMLLSLSVMLSYGAYLAFDILTISLQNSSVGHLGDGTPKRHWSTDVGWTQFFNAWSWAIAEDVRIGAVGLLALLTAPLGWGLFFYHIYLIWAGMTTNESSKWAEWKDDIADGLVYKSNDNTMKRTRQDNIEPLLDWPVRSKQLILRAGNDQLPRHSWKDGSDEQEIHEWERVQGLHEIENLYDLGFWDNLRDILPCQ